MQEQHINCLEGCSIEIPRMIYYTIDDMKKVAMTKKYNCGSSIYLPCIILLSILNVRIKEETHKLKEKQYHSWKRRYEKRSIFNTCHHPTLSHSCLFIRLHITIYPKHCYNMLNWRNDDKNTKREFIWQWHWINPQK